MSARMHPQDLRAIVAAVVYHAHIVAQVDDTCPGGARNDADLLLAELERTAKPECTMEDRLLGFYKDLYEKACNGGLMQHQADRIKSLEGALVSVKAELGWFGSMVCEGPNVMPLPDVIRYAQRDLGRVHATIDAALQASAEPTERTPDPTWIKCSDRMPGDNQLVFAWYFNGNYPVYARHDDRGWEANLGMHDLKFHDYEITHWQPINPPQA